MPKPDLTPSFKNLESEFARFETKPVSRSKATLIYGPYRDDDQTPDSFCVTFYDPAIGQHGEPIWVEGYASLIRLLEEHLSSSA